MNAIEQVRVEIVRRPLAPLANVLAKVADLCTATADYLRPVPRVITHGGPPSEAIDERALFRQTMRAMHRMHYR